MTRNIVIVKTIIILVLAALISACANLQPNFETPSVKLISINPEGGSGFEQRFNIDLRVSNPNAQALNLVGMSYAIELNGFKLVSGTANDIPTITAYGDTKVNIKASVSLLQSARLFASLINTQTSEFNYTFTSKLDTGVPLIGIFSVADSGTLDIAKLKNSRRLTQ